MKKALSLLLVLAMFLTIAPLTVFAYDTEGDGISQIEAGLQSSENLAYGKEVIHPDTALNQGAGANWFPGNLTDGTLNYDAGNDETCGYHSQHNTQISREKNHLEWAGVNFGEVTKFDTLVIYPAKPEGKHGLDTCPGFPNAFRVDVSNDGESWLTLTITVNGDYANSAETIFDYAAPKAEPVTIQFKPVEAQYVRFVGVSLNYFVDGFYLKLSELAVYHREHVPSYRYEYFENIAAGKPVSTPIGGYHTDPTSNWALGNINNGTPYDMCTYDGNRDYGQFTGFHSQVIGGAPNEIAVEIELGEGSTFNQVKIWPSTEKYSGMCQENGGNFYFPENFTFQISDDGNTWTTVKTVTGYSVSEYAAQVFDLDETCTAPYFRFHMTDLGGKSIKLSELEIFDTNKPLTASSDDVKPEETVVVKPNENLALGQKVIASSQIHIPDSWEEGRLNDGEIQMSGGFTTSITNEGAAYVGYAFDQPTVLNKVVLYSSQGGAADINLDLDDTTYLWSGIPQSFKVQYTRDGIGWITVAEKSFDEVPDWNTPVEVTFETVVATQIRIWSDDLYAKDSDFSNKYIQLAEMEVWYDPTVLGSTNAFAAYLQTKENGGNAQDLRVVLVANLNKLPAVESATVKITFTLADGGEKTLTRTLGGESSDYELYRSITAAGETYTACEGCAIFGNIITGIPEGAYTHVAVTITAGGETLLAASK